MLNPRSDVNRNHFRLSYRELLFVMFSIANFSSKFPFRKSPRQWYIPEEFTLKIFLSTDSILQCKLNNVSISRIRLHRRLYSMQTQGKKKRNYTSKETLQRIDHKNMSDDTIFPRKSTSLPNDRKRFGGNRLFFRRNGDRGRTITFRTKEEGKKKGKR